jgi:hypothetical protein
MGLTVGFRHISGSWVPFRLPCPETHPRAKPLRFEAPNAKNTSQTATPGMVHSGPAPIGGGLGGTRLTVALTSSYPAGSIDT